MTVRELLSLIQDLYRDATSDTEKIKFMNVGQKTLSEIFDVVVVDESLSTVAYVDEYSFPDGITDISQIELFEVGSNVPETARIVAQTDMAVGAYTVADSPASPSRVSITHTSSGTTDTLGTITIVGTISDEDVTETLTPIADSTIYGDRYYDTITSVTSAGWVIDAVEGEADLISVGVRLGRYEYTSYSIGYKNDRPMSECCIYQGCSSTGAKSLIMNPAPVASGVPISIRYRRLLQDLSISDLDFEPEFDAKYHEYLAYYACYEMCARGSSPDAGQSNRFAGDAEEILRNLRRQKMRQEIIAPNKRKENPQWLR